MGADFPPYLEPEPFLAVAQFVTYPPWLLQLKSASAEALAFGGLWAFLLDAALVGIVLAFAIDAYAPPQDLPWKPLRLDDPPGLATAVKFQRAAADPDLCREVLAAGGVDFADEPDRPGGDCPLTNILRLRGGVTPLAPAAPVMTCPVALSYAFWDRHVLNPAAQAVMESQVARVEHYGVLACRNVYGRSEGRRSEHASANALDVSAIVLEDAQMPAFVDGQAPPGISVHVLPKPLEMQRVFRAVADALGAE